MSDDANINDMNAENGSAETEAENPPDRKVADEAAKEEMAQDSLEQMRDRVLRALAEAENTRRRAEKDVADARKFAIAGFARDILSVADNMQRALDAAPDDAADDSVLGNLIMGLRMVERELQSALERHGVRKIHPLGEKFDPNFHQAVAEIPGGGEKGQVLEVTQPGYALGDRVLRAAMVVVSNGQGAGPGDDGGQDPAEAGPGASIDTTA